MPAPRGLLDFLFSGANGPQLERVEAKLDLLLDSLGVKQTAVPPSRLSDEVKALAVQPRKKFAAVKLHRQQTGMGLDEAERAVSAYLRSTRKPRRKARA